MILKSMLLWAWLCLLNSRNLAQTLSPSKANELVDYRLPSALLPTHYNLYWHPDLSTGNFTGQLKIAISVREATNQIVLHAHKLQITSVYVLLPDGFQTLEVGNFALHELRELLIIDMVEQLAIDSNITLGLLFEGQMMNKLVGLYSSKYLTSAGEERTIATTKFEPTYARQAFPCFDEPALKATFDITVVHPTGSYHALSNMDQKDSTYLGEYTEALFASSVPMSTYLVCIIVSDFAYEAKTVNAPAGLGSNFEMRAFTTPHQLHKVQFALDFGVAVTEYYIQSYKVPYPLPKLDMAAIPDFASGAMEHWGLVTYRETALLYDEDYSSTGDKQSIASVLAHEIAHMWFGNLVTMKWWNDIWLNEGFARYMQYKGVNFVFPDWNMLEQFQINALHSVLAFDAKLSSHPIVQTVETPNQITAIFDTISYDKGGSVIRMLENLVGTERFEQSVTNYLEKYQFANAETNDFLSEVAELVDEYDVKLLMRTWTEQMGYPVLEVERQSGQSFLIRQKRFLSNNASYAEAPNDSEFGYRWTIPITYFLDTYEANTISSFVFNYDDEALSVVVTENVRWLKLNVHQLGYYRVNYEPSLWLLLIDELVANPARFDIADRAHLINDAFALADASQLDYSVPLELTAYLAQERDFVPWYVAAQALQALQRSFMYSEGYSSYLEYARLQVANVYAEVGWTVEANDHLRNRLRVTVLGAACALGLPDCLGQATQRFESWLQNPTANRPVPDLRSIVYHYGIQQSHSESSWLQLLALFQAEQDASEKLKLLRGLAGVHDAQLLYRLLDLATDESIVRPQDYFTCLGYIAANTVGEPLLWDYYREHWPELVARFGLSDRYLGRLIATITKNFASNVKLEEMQRFFDKYPEAGAGASARIQALETVKYNIQWLQQNSADISNWLQGTSTPLAVKTPLAGISSLQ